MSAVDILERNLGSRIVGSTARDWANVICPFHKDGQESTPSARANTETGFFWCNACHRGWSLEQLLLDLGMDPVEVEIELEDLELDDRVRLTPEEVFIPDSVLGAYHACPVVMLKAGFSKEVLKEHEVGWDSVNKRVTFPIRDYRGRLVAIQGRTTQGEKQRYVIYKSELEAVVKLEEVKLHNHVWGLHLLYEQGLHEGLPELIVVEGIKKALWLKQNGWHYVVALNGSNYSNAQHSLLSRLHIGKLVLLLDNDKAGQLCAERMANLFAGYTSVLWPKYPEGKSQPDGLHIYELTQMLNQEGRRLHVQRSNE